MAFKLHRKERIPDGLVRIAVKALDEAHETLRTKHQSEGVHRARKETKRVRALLPLLCPFLPRARRHSAGRALRKAAALLGRPRDGFVQAAAGDQLARECRAVVDPKRWRAFRDVLARRSDLEAKRFVRRGNDRRVRRLLKHARKELTSATMDSGGWSAFASALRREYKTAHRRYLRLSTDLSAQQLHAWRKSAKRVGFHLLLFRKAAPHELDLWIDPLEELSECLGTHHDLELLRQQLANASPALPAVMRKLDDCIDAQQAQLTARAAELGARVFAEKPREYERVLRSFWRPWRRGDSRRRG